MLPSQSQDSSLAPAEVFKPATSPALDWLKGSQEGGGCEWLFSCFRRRKCPLIFHGATPEVNYLQSGRPPVSATICQSNTQLPEPPLKGPPVEDQPSLEVEEKEMKKKKSTHAIQFILISVRQVDCGGHALLPSRWSLEGPSS